MGWERGSDVSAKITGGVHVVAGTRLSVAADRSIWVVFSCSSKLKFRYFRYGKRGSDETIQPRLLI